MFREEPGEKASTSDGRKLGVTFGFFLNRNATLFENILKRLNLGHTRSFTNYRLNKTTKRKRNV